MVRLRIIPTVLYRGYSTVKGEKFESWRVVGNIIQAVKIYSLREVDELIVLNIDLSKNKEKIDFDLVSQFARECTMPLTVGGGVSSLEDIDKLLRSGADKVSINTSAIKNLKFIETAIKKFGSQCIVISVDYKKCDDGKLEIFTKSGSEATGIELLTFIKNLKKINPGEVLITSIDHEGRMQGYDVNVIEKVSNILNCPIIASGGCGSYNHMLDVVKTCPNVSLAAASIFQFTENTPMGANQFLKLKGFNVRK